MEHSVLMVLDPINVCVQMDSMVKTVIKVSTVFSVDKLKYFNTLFIILDHLISSVSIVYMEYSKIL